MFYKRQGSLDGIVEQLICCPELAVMQFRKGSIKCIIDTWLSKATRDGTCSVDHMGVCSYLHADKAEPGQSSIGILDGQQARLQQPLQDAFGLILKERWRDQRDPRSERIPQEASGFFSPSFTFDNPFDGDAGVYAWHRWVTRVSRIRRMISAASVSPWESSSRSSTSASNSSARWSRSLYGARLSGAALKRSQISATSLSCSRGDSCPTSCSICSTIALSDIACNYITVPLRV